MKDAIESPREEINENAPKILSMKVEEDKIGAIIGTGGKTIKGIATQTGAEVNISDDGTITIYGKNNADAQKAKALVNAIIEEPEEGKIYQGVVKRIMDFGAFVEILPGKEGLCHISKLDKKRVKSVDEVLSLGQEIPVKLIEIDRQGRLNLSYIDAISPEDSSDDESSDKSEKSERSDKHDKHDKHDKYDKKKSFKKKGLKK
jgi:polyribonucleotide nucleotidyltransferase